LLLRHRGRTGLIQRDVAARAGVSLRSVQEWEAGDKFPTAERLQTLIQVLLDAGGMNRGREQEEARELWSAAERESPRMRTPFDDSWFARLVAANASQSPEHAPRAPGTWLGTELETSALERSEDWGDAPDTMRFVGRADELTLLSRWVLEERCRVVAVLGIGGIGKTSLAAKLTKVVAPRFERVYWRSLRNAPPANEWLAGAIGFLSDYRVVPPSSESERINTLLQLIRARSCLLVLDNSETLFEPGQRELRYRADMNGYGRLLQVAGDASHQSCLIVTSREAPPELGLLTGVRELELHGLGIAEAQALLADKELHGDTQTWSNLVARYGGNGLALKIVGETVRQVYAGEIDTFLVDGLASYGGVFGGIRRLLDVQVERLSPVERELLTRLAVEREPISLTNLSTDMAAVEPSTVVEAIETLRRRSLVERGDRSATFTLQSMVLEYTTDRLVETIADEISREHARVLVEQPLIKAQAQDYVRETQERLIGEPILNRLNAQYPGQLESRLLGLLDTWRGRSPTEQGYGPGNVVNLLRLLRRDLRGVDLSHLTIRQAYLAVVDFQSGNLAGAQLADTVLAQSFVDLPSVALSADGALLAAGTGGGEVWLWRVADRTPLLGLAAHTGTVWSVALAADGELLASGSGDGSVRLWETKTGRQRAALHGHSGDVWGVALSADGRLVASGGWDGTVRIWNTTTGRELAVLHGHTGTIRSVALSADGQLVASAGGDGTVRSWDTKSGRPFQALHGHTGGVWSVALSADGRVLASGGDDETIRLWEPTSGRELTTLHGHAGVVWGVAITPDGEQVASSGEDGTVRLWETSSGRPLITMHGHSNEAQRVALSADGHLVASCGLDTAVRLWDARTGRPLGALHGNPMLVSDVSLSADGQVLATKGPRGPRLWETATGHPLTTPLGRTDAVWRVALSADGGLLAGGCGDGTVCVWDTSTGRPLASLPGHNAAIWGLVLSADGRLLAAGCGDGIVRLWEMSTGRELAAYRGHTGVVWRVALSADSKLAASGGADGTVRLWDTGTGRPVGAVDAHAGGVYGVSLSAAGHVLASGGGDGLVRLWDGRTGRPLATLQGHTSVVWNVGVSGAGNVVASGSMDGMIRVWEGAAADEWRPRAIIQGHIGTIQAMAISADGHLLVSGSRDGIVRLWDTGSGACLRTLRAEGRYEGLNITGVTGITDAQRTALLSLGAIDRG
jgi:WD40 repeat protein/transcriptional regulator with XRE-family HTH domain